MEKKIGNIFGGFGGFFGGWGLFLGFKLGLDVKMGRIGKIGKIFLWKNEEKFGFFEKNLENLGTFLEK